MKLQKLMKQADDSIFDEIISACEKKMVSPFAKKEVEIEVVPEDQEAEQSELTEEEIEQLKALLGKGE